MNIEIHGIVGWICGICIGTTAVVAVLAGIWQIWNLFLFEIIIGSAFRWLRLYKTFGLFIYYRRRIIKWIAEAKKEEAEGKFTNYND